MLHSGGAVGDQRRVGAQEYFLMHVHCTHYGIPGHIMAQGANESSINSYSKDPTTLSFMNYTDKIVSYTKHRVKAPCMMLLHTWQLNY